MDDPYARLRPPPPTPPDEICSCEVEKPVKLMDALGPNPIHCIDCNLEVPPERIGFGADLAERIAHWARRYGSIDCLWLDSGEYEEWARRELSDIRSPVNEEGMAVRAEIDKLRTCFYWYFQDESAADFRALSLCPLCREPLDDYDEGIFAQRFCRACGILGVGGASAR